jgi:hypothetical protein
VPDRLTGIPGTERNSRMPLDRRSRRGRRVSAASLPPTITASSGWRQQRVPDRASGGQCRTAVLAPAGRAIRAPPVRPQTVPASRCGRQTLSDQVGDKAPHAAQTKSRSAQSNRLTRP